MQRGPSCLGGAFGWGATHLAPLLAASILSSCIFLTEGQSTNIQITILLRPERPIVGQNVTLVPQISSGSPMTCSWYRGLGTIDENLIFIYYPPPNDIQTNGVAFSERETGGPGCTLHFRNLTSGDTGNYTVFVGIPGKSILGFAYMVISEVLSSPVLWPSDVMVKENTNVILNCSTSNSPDVSVSWFKDGKLLTAGAHLSDLNRTLTLYNISKSSAGLYRCRARNLVSNMESNPVSVTVAYGPDIKLDPEGKIEKSLNSDLKLECSADSVPDAQFQWFFNSIKQDATRSIFRVRLTNWTDEGNYSCQATNPFTFRSAMKTAYVKLTEVPDPVPLSGGAIAGIIIGSLVVTALIVGTLLYIFFRDQRDKTLKQGVAAPPVTYENVFPSRQVKTDSSANSNHTYETLQYADQSVYQQMKGRRQVGQPSPHS